MFDVLLLLTAVSLFAYAFYKWVTKNYNYFKDRNLAFITPKFLVGNFGAFLTKQLTAQEFSDYLYNAHPTKKLYGIFSFRQPALVVRDPEVLKQITIKDFEYFEDKRLIGNDSDKLIGKSLIMMKGTKWHDMRSTLSPAFTGSKMRLMFDLIMENSINMSTQLRKKNTSLELDMKELFNKLTIDMTANTAFGIKINSFEDENNEFYLMAKNLLNFNRPKILIKMVFLNVMPKLAAFFDVQMFEPQVAEFFRGMVWSNMETRQREGIFRPDLINLLMQIRKGEEVQSAADENKTPDGFATVEEFSVGKKSSTRRWSDEEIIAQCFLFFFAGFDPISNHLGFTTYELAVNPDVQQKLFEEILDVESRLNGKNITYDQLQKMKYLDMVITESLRKWPPIALTDRMCVKDYTYEEDGVKFVIRKGMMVAVPSMSFHYDEKYFPNSKVFDPERFNDENRRNIVPGTYLPFGIGPRNCIGSRYALMQAKVTIYYLLLNFKLVPYDKTQIPLKLAKTPMGMFTDKGIHLKFETRP
ncbi:putative cytochrome P450 9f2 [Pseudolycoriella hygida]|uniref:Cytochrome P450 9f2 n=1 Tax=Pseudolycoriella hygida TaxID=35572 RepID=A0A9Q0MSD1_9DIPT|nr:putative cytochrome P450 9f2 [Pseudolycoriella hygida]